MKQNHTISALIREFDSVREKLAKRIGEEIPVGSEVALINSRASIPGTVTATPSGWGDPFRFVIRCRTGHRMSADYRNLILIRKKEAA